MAWNSESNLKPLVDTPVKWGDVFEKSFLDSNTPFATYGMPAPEWPENRTSSLPDSAQPPETKEELLVTSDGLNIVTKSSFKSKASSTAVRTSTTTTVDRTRFIFNVSVTKDRAGLIFFPGAANWIPSAPGEGGHFVSKEWVVAVFSAPGRYRLVVTKEEGVPLQAAIDGQLASKAKSLVGSRNEEKAFRFTKCQ